MSELLKKYESIDQSKLNEATIKIINRVKTITADFTADDEKNNKIAEQVLDSVMQKNPDAVKIIKREPKAKPAPKKTHKATHTAKKAHTAKATHTTSSAPKTSNNIMSVAKEIQKAGESWKDAMERAKEVLKERRGEVVQKQKTELEKLYALVKTKKELQGFANSDIRRDSVRTAKVSGARFVTKEGFTSNQHGVDFPNKLGRKYWETRDRHADRLAPNYPKDMPLLAKGGGVDYYEQLVVYVQGEGSIYNGTSMKKAIDKANLYLKTNPKAEIAIVDEKYGDEYDLNGNLKEEYAKGGNITNEDKLLKELHKLQRDLNSFRLSTYIEGDNSQEEIARQRERESKLARFNEVLKTLRESDKFVNGGQVKNLISILNSKYSNNGMSLKDLHDETIMYLGKEQGGLVFQEFIKENKGNEKFMKEFNKTSFADGGSLPFMTDPNFGSFQNTGSFADGGYFDKLEDVRFLFNVGEKIKIPQMENGKIQLVDAEVIEQYPAEQNDGTYYPFYYVKGMWENAGKMLYDEEKLLEYGNKPKKSFADGGSLPFMTDPNFGSFQNTGSFADGGYFDKLEDVRFLFNVGEKIKIPQMENGKIQLVDAEVIEQYPAEQNDGTYYPFYYVKGMWENAGKMLYDEEKLLEYGNKPKKSFADGGSFAEGGLLVNNSTDLEEVAKYMFTSVKKRSWDLRDLIHYFNEDNGFDYRNSVKVWDDMNGYEMRKNYDNILEMLKRIVEANNKKFELGGAFMMTDLAGHTGGSDGLGNPMPLSGVSGTHYTGLVGETGAMSSGELFEAGGAMMQNQQVINDASQSYVNYYLNDGGGVFKDGGSIPNNYEGRTDEDVWSNWTEAQRSHFLLDHSELLDNDRMENNLGYTRTVQKDKTFTELTPLTKRVLDAHIRGGQYAYGGKTKSAKPMKELYIEQIASLTGTRTVGVEKFVDDNNLNETELSNLMTGLGRGMISRGDFVTALTGEKGNSIQKEVIAFAKSDKAYKMADGGFMSGVYAKGGMLNKKVNDELNFYLGDVINDVPMSQWIIKTILKSALTDANFHNASKEVDSIFTKAKYTESAQFSKLQEDAITKRLESKGRDIAKMCDYDAFEIIDSIAFYVSMNMGRPLGEKIENLKNIFADGGFMNNVYAKGGSTDEVAKIKVSSPDGKYVDVWYITKDTDTTHFYISNSPESKGMAYHVGQFRSEVFYDDLRSWLKGGSNINGNEYKSNSYANGGSFEDNYGFMRADNENNYRFPERPVHVDTLDEPIDLTDNVSYKSNEVVIEPVDQDMNMNEDGRIRARMTQSNRGSAENFAKINPNSFEFIPMPTSNKHKND
jgi:hypothetical protein